MRIFGKKNASDIRMTAKEKPESEGITEETLDNFSDCKGDYDDSRQ